MGTREQIAAILDDALGITVPDFDADMIAQGLFDSLVLVTLLVEIEQRFDIQISLETVEVERLATINRMAVLVDELTQKQTSDPSVRP